MSRTLSDEGFDLIFRKARTYNGWIDKPVSDDTIRQVYDLMKWGPTSANTTPARFVFIRSKSAKERLKPALAPGNIEKMMAAPAVVIVAYDLRFYEKLPLLFSQNKGMHDLFTQNPQLVESTAMRNSSLQGAYFMLAARSLGLDCGPMSGFDNAKVDEEFFATGKECPGGQYEYFPEGHLKSNFLCNIGYGDSSRVYPRNPRLDFDEACKIL